MNVTVVTGAATGIGRALCERLLGAGGRVIAVDINEGDLTWATGRKGAVGCVADVSTEEGNATMVKAAIEHFGGLDAAAFNAGVRRVGSIETMSIDDYRLMHDVNVNGCILGIRAVIPALRRRGRGAMVATASIGGYHGARDGWGYGATKAAIINLVKSVALDVGRYDIRVNAVCPGPTRDTAMFDRLDEREPPTYEAWRRGIALQRWGKTRRDRGSDAVLAVRRRVVRDRNHHRRGRWRNSGPVMAHRRLRERPVAVSCHRRIEPRRWNASLAGLQRSWRSAASGRRAPRTAGRPSRWLRQPRATNRRRLRRS